MLQTNLGHLTVVHNAQGLVGNLHAYGFDLLKIGGQGSVLMHQGVQAVQRRLNGRTHGPALDARAHDFKALAQGLPQSIAQGVDTVGIVKIALSREHILHPREAIHHHHRSTHPIASGHATKIKGFFNVIFVTHPARNT